MMQDAIKGFAKQFAFTPVVANGPVPRKPHTIVLGMGGSHLAADILAAWQPERSLTIHSDYGLPPLPPSVLKDSLVIASSYSGNTEEVLDGFAKAQQQGLAVAALAVGGKLLELANQNNVPYVQLPDTGIQPRSALGFSLLALLKLMGNEEGLQEAAKLSQTLKPEKLEPEGRALAEQFRGKVPVIYASTPNRAIAYNWKIKLNETGKIPAFMNVIPELNHNEMNGFDARDASRELSRQFAFIFLRDRNDHSRNQKRFEVVRQQYENRGFPVTILELKGKTPLEKIFRSLLVADWFAVHTAESYGLESEQVPMIEEFKQLIG
ncbi:MAG: hypothetical protein HYZ09_00725 [Candidatus Kerfeldbacteria bacterium]|nr:hypothetical protein [Candidatus Kerfeldbacteria bacterium]